MVEDQGGGQPQAGDGGEAVAQFQGGEGVDAGAVMAAAPVPVAEAVRRPAGSRARNMVGTSPRGRAPAAIRPVATR
nr:hypothetical protein [Kitasatospora aureofaciens]